MPLRKLWASRLRCETAPGPIMSKLARRDRWGLLGSYRLKMRLARGRRSGHGAMVMTNESGDDIEAGVATASDGIGGTGGAKVGTAMVAEPRTLVERGTSKTADVIPPVPETAAPKEMSVDAGTGAENDVRRGRARSEDGAEAQGRLVVEIEHASRAYLRQ